MRLAPLFLLALGACSSQPDKGNWPGNAASPLPVESETPTPDSQASAPLDPPAPGQPRGLANDKTPVREAPFAADSAQGAANVVQSYYALLEAGKYGEAYRLWEPAAVGMNAAAFGASFGKYAEYHANIGTPGPIGAGAGQRYVTVPVQVYGRLAQGNRPFNMRGSLTLHRAEADGATADQRRWRIRSSDIEPHPGEATPSPQPTEDNRSTARYRCVDGSRLVARFDPDHDRVTVARGGTALSTLPGQRVASGIRYAAHGYELRGKGYDISFTAPGKPPIACTAIR